MKKWHFFSVIFRTRATCPVHITYFILYYTGIRRVVCIILNERYPISRAAYCPAAAPVGPMGCPDEGLYYYTRPPNVAIQPVPTPAAATPRPKTPRGVPTATHYVAYNNTNPGIRWRYVNTLILYLHCTRVVVKRGTKTSSHSLTIYLI